MFATDLYGAPGTWSGEAAPVMLRDPTEVFAGHWNPRRLVVQHMDALDLRYEDAGFDGVFSSSSVEHFGTHADIRVAVREMYRVLRPGGILSLSTELRLVGGLELPGTHLFTPEELRRNVIDPAPWELLGSLDLHVSAATQAGAQLYAEAVAAAQAGLPPVYPHLVLVHGDTAWTSVHLALRRPAA